MAVCFCGCGNKCPWHARAINKRGRLVNRDLAEAQSLLEGLIYSPSVVEHIRNGEIVSSELARFVHEDLDINAHRYLESHSRAWRRTHGLFFTADALTRSLQIAEMQLGVGPDQLAAMVIDDQTDPFLFQILSPGKLASRMLEEPPTGRSSL